MVIRFYAYNPNNFKDKYLIVNDTHIELLSSAGFIDRLFEDFESDEKEVLYSRPVAISMDLVRRQGDSKLFDAIMFLIDNFDDPVVGPSLVYEIIERLGLPRTAVETRPVKTDFAQVELE